MATDEQIKARVYDIGKSLTAIKEKPQTYETLLCHLHSDSTLRKIINRKLNKEIKRGNVCKTSIPGTRFGKAIFYTIPKEYNILVKSHRLYGNEVFCFSSYEEKGKFYIGLTEYWKLDGDKWVQGEEEIIIFDGDILKWI